MADAYARVKRGPGLCMAQSVGAVNLSAGLQDAYLACSPVIAITGRENEQHQQRNAYQEVDHINPFSAVTKYSAYVATPEQFPTYLRQAFRSAMSGTPRPVHLDLEGLAGQHVFDQEGDLEVILEEGFSQLPPFRPEAEKEKINQYGRDLGKSIEEYSKQFRMGPGFFYYHLLFHIKQSAVFNCNYAEYKHANDHSTEEIARNQGEMLAETCPELGLEKKKELDTVH